MPLLQRVLAPVEELLYGTIGWIAGGPRGEDLFEDVEDPLAA